MKRKIFISLNIPTKVKRRLVSIAQKWQDLPVKWVRENNLHNTLLFLGYVDIETLVDICQKVRDTTAQQEAFDIAFDKIELFPDKEAPQMIAATGEADENLRLLHENITKALGLFTSSHKVFRPHITIGRIRKLKWDELAQKPSIQDYLSLTLPVESFSIMASDFGDGQDEYTVIEDCPLR